MQWKFNLGWNAHSQAGWCQDFCKLCSCVGCEKRNWIPDILWYMLFGKVSRRGQNGINGGEWREKAESIWEIFKSHSGKNWNTESIHSIIRDLERSTNERIDTEERYRPFRTVRVLECFPKHRSYNSSYPDTQSKLRKHRIGKALFLTKTHFGSLWVSTAE